MATCVLVHGGHHDVRVWATATPSLKKAGHDVSPLTRADPKKTTLAGHISEVCSPTGNNRLDNIFLTGHSYGSMVITDMADRLPERFLRLTYLISTPECEGNGY